MINFNPGDPVVTVINGKLVHGKVVSFYPQISTAIVVTEDKEYIKVPSDSISPEPEEPKKEGITITEKEFINISSQIISEEYAKLGIDDEFILLSTAVIFSKICEALFMRKENQQ